MRRWFDKGAFDVRLNDGDTDGVAPADCTMPLPSSTTLVARPFKGQLSHNCVAFAATLATHVPKCTVVDFAFCTAPLCGVALLVFDVGPYRP